MFAYYKDIDGLHYTFAIPKCLEVFTESVNNYIRLKQKSNHHKRVAIYYYKGSYQNALTVGGMEVIHVLYNFLLDLMEQGYSIYSSYIF